MRSTLAGVDGNGPLASECGINVARDIWICGGAGRLVAGRTRVVRLGVHRCVRSGRDCVVYRRKGRRVAVILNCYTRIIKFL